MTKIAAVVLGLTPAALVIAGVVLVARGHRRAGIWLEIGAVAVFAAILIGLEVARMVQQ